MDRTTSLDKFRCPYGGQEVELLQVEYEAGGMPLIRLRIRERQRFTIFDMDAQTATRWAEAMLAWARSQPRGAASGDE
jgi:hypothetical protein